MPQALVAKLKHITLFTLSLLLYVTAAGQKYNQEIDDYAPDAKRKDKFGIRVGVGITRLNSPQLVNTKVSHGYEGAFYYRVNLFKGFHLNPELGASIKGSRFANSNVDYTQISLFNFDGALLGIIQLDPSFNHNLVVGVQASRIMRSSMFIGPEQFPSYLQLPFKKWDYAAVLGYQFNTQYVGFQLALKYGFRNIAGDFYNFNKVSSNNNGQQFVDVTPSLRNVKDVKNFSVELSMYF